MLQIFRDTSDTAELVGTLLGFAVILFVCLPMHEWAHGYAAYRLGDPTARSVGRLSFNPLRHLDPIGTLMIVLIGFGYAKPVPVDVRYLRHPKRDMAVIAAMGPISNLIMAFLAMAILRVFWIFFNPFLWMYRCGYYLLLTVVSVNIGLAVFNLLPVPPLDGSRILARFLPSKWTFMMMRYQQYTSIILLGLIITGVLGVPLAWVSSRILDLFKLILFF